MDVVTRLSSNNNVTICVGMHTTGESTRILIHRIPGLNGALLGQRSQASRQYDHIRRCLMVEPRGHTDMYGAVLCRETECTRSGEVDTGVLCLSNEGYSTMRGHATIALGRFLIDTTKRCSLSANTCEMIRPRRQCRYAFHAPYGIVRVTVPTIAVGTRSDPTRSVVHVSVPSFATGIDVRVSVPMHWR